ncbi:MAG: hypothetical protein JSR66_09430 [Proteobacteria bacterium]|nr:hypothetical protein [Pseudomonadota bacterium]
MKMLALFHVGIVALALTAFSGHAHAATLCNTGPAPAAPLSGTITGGVVVNAGNFCVLGGANVSGGVRVNAGGILIVCGTTINGGLTANGAAEVIVGAEELDCAGGLINGGVQINNTGPGAFAPAPSIALERSTINGTVRLTGNTGPIAVATDTISGSLLCSNNAFKIDDEGSPVTVTGALRCSFTDAD